MKGQDNLVSVIIPVFNKEKYVQRCLDSVRRSLYSDLEIILVDDGSTDASLDICNNIANEDSRIRVFSQPNGGVSSARNLAIEKSTGKYLTFVDPDDTLSANMLSELIQLIELYSADMAYCYSRDIFTDKIIIPSQNSGKFFLLDSKKYDWMATTAHVTVWGGVYKRELIGKTRFDTFLKIGEDTLFFAKLVKKSNRIVVLDKPLYDYFINNDSVTSGRWNPQKKDELIAREMMCKLFADNNGVQKSAKAAAANCCKDVVGKYCKDASFVSNDSKFCRKMYNKYAKSLFAYQLKHHRMGEALKTLYARLFWKKYVLHSAKKRQI